MCILFIVTLQNRKRLTFIKGYTYVDRANQLVSLRLAPLFPCFYQTSTIRSGIVFGVITCYKEALSMEPMLRNVHVYRTIL